MQTQRQIHPSGHVRVCLAHRWGVRLVAVLFGLMAALEVSNGQSSAAGPGTNDIWIVEQIGLVEVLVPDSTVWISTTTNQVLGPRFRVRTGLHAKAVLRWSNQSVVPMGPSTELEILPPADTGSLFGMNLFRGIISFFHRDKPGRLRIATRGVNAGIQGTEFVLQVDTSGPAERTRLSVVDGRVRFYNNQGSIELTNNQESVAIEGQAPSPAVGFVANNRLQWCFYYPGILDLRDLPLAAAEETALAESLRAYRMGDLLAALRLYPAGRTPGSDAERLYRAALFLSVGQVPQTEAELALLSAGAASDRIQRLATALRVLIAAVRREPNPSTLSPQLSTELMAQSYYQQSLAIREKSLEAALQLARRAAEASPSFGFAWERVAELEFSFGRIGAAEEAFEKSFTLSPRNAQAMALEGFLLAAKNKTSQAIEWFNYAIVADPSLGNAWLGRGLSRIRRGDLERGREDLLVAAALEPQRALLRSYLGKAYGEEGDFRRATKELDRAKSLDPKDPTSWLYSALLNQQYNRINEAIRDLEYSQELNENRSVYRSGLLLDEDRAVRSANLAAIYRDAGMFDVSVREASRAVSYDYANYSAHLFLANSYDELRDPNRINLRYETPSDVEYLLANLLAPVGAGTLSPSISQQEYSKLFERDRLGLISDTEYLSRGAWTENGAQYGTYGDFSYSLEAFYRSDRGQRANNDVVQRQLSVQAKAQLTPQDTVYIQALHYDATGGDLAQYPDQSFANPQVRFHEKQEPILGLGYHREWSPGVHTLFFAARLQDTLSLTNPAQPTLLAFVPFGSVTGARSLGIQQDYRTELEIYSAELQQIFERGDHNTIIGGRVQWGHFTTRNEEDTPSSSPIFFPQPPTPAADQDFLTHFERASAYGYHFWNLPWNFELIGGLSYDRLVFPKNFRFAPISPETETTDKISPKAGLIWTPTKRTTLRFAYTRSLTGASFDQSFQLEPSQIAGFIQSYRSIIPESVSGPNAGAEFETYGLSLEQDFPTGTYLGLTGGILNSKVNRTVGAFIKTQPQIASPSGLNEDLDYREYSLVATANQLIGNGWSLGARYGLTRSRLTDVFPQAQDARFLIDFQPSQESKSLLHQLDLFVVYNHPWGLFARCDALWYGQSNENETNHLLGEHFWQVNALLGYRFPGRRAELSFALLNLNDQNYNLNPLTLYNDLPRGRTMAFRFLLNF